MQTAEKLFDENSLWWQMKVLSLLVTVDEQAFAGDIRAKLKELEAQFVQKAEAAEQKAAELILDGKQEAGRAVLSSVTKECTEILYAFAKTERKRLERIIREKGGLYGRQKEAIEKYIAYAQIPIFEN